MDYTKLLDTIMTHVETIDEHVDDKNTDQLQLEVDTLWSLVTDAQHQQWLKTILETP